LLKIGTLFSGGLAACEWAFKYEEIEHEVVFACEWDKFARQQYLAFHGEPTSQFYINVGENPLDLYKPFVWSIDCVLNSHKIKSMQKYKKADKLISLWKKKHNDVSSALKYITGKKKLVYFSNIMDKSHLSKMNYDIDLMVWGSPCQDLSLAGKRAGFDGAKSSLFREGARIMGEVMPKVFIFENVKGLLSSNGGADYKEVEKTFRDLGYHMAMKVVNAKEQGTAQNRERVFIVGFLDADAYHSFSFSDAIPLTKTLKDYLDDVVDEKYYLSDKMIAGFIAHSDRHKEKGSGFNWKPKDEDDIANCLRANAALNTSDSSIKVPILQQVGELDIKGNDSIKRVYGIDGICPTMTTMGGVIDNPKFFCLLLLR
jgi:site-specific DNA-cytosine methylase